MMSDYHMADTVIDMYQAWMKTNPPTHEKRYWRFTAEDATELAEYMREFRLEGEPLFSATDLRVILGQEVLSINASSTSLGRKRISNEERVADRLAAQGVEHEVTSTRPGEYRDCVLPV